MLTSATSSSRSAPALRILETADRLFYRDGIRATGIDRIIAESGVAKKTFYRHYPSKADLIVAFLQYHYRNWTAWFRDALSRHGGNPAAVAPALHEWLSDKNFRGCACINSIVEIAELRPEILQISHKRRSDIAKTIRRLLPKSSGTAAGDARAIAIAIDGAIISVQMGDTPRVALRSLERIVAAVAK